MSWTELSSVVSTDTELKQLIAGERYVLLINSASHRVESAAPIELQYTLCEYYPVSGDLILELEGFVIDLYL